MLFCVERFREALLFLRASDESHANDAYLKVSMKFFKKRTEKTKKQTLGSREGESRPIVGILTFVAALLLFVALWDYNPSQNPLLTTDPEVTNKVGKVGVFFAFFLFSWLGAATWMIPFSCGWMSRCFFKKMPARLNWRKGLSWFALYFGGVGLLAACQHVWAYTVGSEYNNGWGGAVGSALFDTVLVDSMGVFGSVVILMGLFSSGTVGIFWEDGYLHAFQVRFSAWVARLAGLKTKFTERMAERAIAKAEALENVEILAPEPKVKAKKKRKPKEEVTPELEEEPEVVVVSSAPVKKPREKAPVPTQETSSDLKIIAGERVERAADELPKKRGAYSFPTLSLLQDPVAQTETSVEDHQETAGALVRTLSEFGVKVIPGEVHTGPVITRYEVTPAAGVRVEKIANLDKNIALALKATSVRVLAPVPGKGSVGIEVPNAHPSPVCLREIVESTSWVKSKAEIPIVLGKEVTGKPIVTDLTKMPHLLIAGSTGSGKTVCINAIIASLFYHSSPDDLRFMMVDPKIVEMQVYNSLPHMLIPVVTDPKKVPGALKWLIAEMERRYQMFAQVGARNIAGFNGKVLKGKAEKVKAEQLDAELSPEERAAVSSIEVPRDQEIEIEKKKLPYIVCIVDELADLMMVAPADIETCIARLAQLARAAGIHLVLATQRPSVNVITGVIKANLPCRIAFKVASKVDSRTILDAGGADALIGRGDMLFIPPGTSHTVRAQGAFVSDDEINSIVEYLKKNGPPQYAQEVQQQIDSGGPGGEEGGDWDDDLVPDAIEVIRASKRASTSMLQRRLRIGYNRAARIMEILEDYGYVGPENGAQPREILKDLDSV